MVQEVMNHIMASPGNPSTEVEDPYDRKPYNSPALNNVDKLSIASPQDLLTKEKMASIGLEFRLHEVTRWKPRVVSLSPGQAHHSSLTPANLRPHNSRRDSRLPV